MPVMTVSLPPELADKVKAAVDGGTFASDSEVIRHALHHWFTENHIDLSKGRRVFRRRDPSEVEIAALFAAFRANKIPRGDA